MPFCDPGYFFLPFFRGSPPHRPFRYERPFRLLQWLRSHKSPLIGPAPSFLFFFFPRLLIGFISFFQVQSPLFCSFLLLRGGGKSFFFLDLLFSSQNCPQGRCVVRTPPIFNFYFSPRRPWDSPLFFPPPPIAPFFFPPE